MQTNWLKYVFFLFFRQFHLHFETKWKLAEPRTDRKSLTERRNPSRIDAKPTTTKLTRPISVQLPSSFLFLEQNKKLCEHHVPAFQKVKMPRRKDLLSCFVDGSLADSYCYWISRFFVCSLQKVLWSFFFLAWVCTWRKGERNVQKEKSGTSVEKKLRVLLLSVVLAWLLSGYMSVLLMYLRL